jgi:hypothetical protein
MRPLALVALAMLLDLSVARADVAGGCGVASNLAESDFALALTAKAIANKTLTIAVVGAGSSTLPGADAKAYPARLQVALSGLLPGVDVKVHADVKSGRTAGDSVKPIKAELAALHPALIVWQAGTVDAMKSVDLDEFSAALDKGIDAAHTAGSDMVLVNAQYSPRTESIIALGTYADHMRWVALRHDIPLFDRYSIMKLWAELGTFDFTTTTKKLEMAENVHDCIGRLLAELIVTAAKSVDAPPPSVR